MKTVALTMDRRVWQACSLCVLWFNDTQGRQPGMPLSVDPKSSTHTGRMYHWYVTTNFVLSTWPYRCTLTEHLTPASIECITSPPEVKCAAPQLSPHMLSRAPDVHTQLVNSKQPNSNREICAAGVQQHKQTAPLAAHNHVSSAVQVQV